ncbi:MAG TPA: Clp protease N-terminal domain-containing protein [Phycisphaerae bacterium]|jgi:ATP-dependent Clp protease ATP-binding subunit ClpC|nr:ATP-dependent Clp protease ATP-binding subunit [Phycisphaerae bacterium]HPM22500.1 Clp protease N-terminal domain-containing protein [Phycisphaerae bacterium]HQL55725.1 Clp protease N-terminal domain-containing protein [Phycisphaerae bacterium]
MPLRRLDADARAVVNLANDIAHEYEMEYVGTEHILLAILRHDDNVGARALHKLGVDEDKVRAAIDDIVQRAKEDTWVFGRLPGSPHYRNVIERAMEVAEQLESQSIGSAHLLLALYHDKESTAQRTLTGLGVTLKKCRDQVLRELAAG